VTRAFRGFAAAVALLPLVAPAAEPDKFDYNQPQSPARPKPEWLKIIDQGANDPRLRGYFTPEGLKVEIVADFPTVMNPVGMTFADDGTLYVLEWVPGGANWNEYPETFIYQDGTKRQVMTMKKPVKDRVKVLRDTKGTGVYDEASVILEDELPSSILLHDGWLYLSGRGTVRRYRQSRPAGPYDVKQVIAQGFCGFHHHQVSGLTLGNDGWLYVTSGDDDNYVEGSDGSRATVLRTGAVFRCRPDGSKVQVYSIGYRNPYRDVAFDTAFNVFHADNDNEDGSKFMGCRLMHVAEGSDFGWRLFTGARCCRPDPVRGAAYGELPGKLPPMLKTGRGAPAGLIIYNDTRFPEQYRGLLYYPDVFRKLIRAYKVEPRGATFAVTEEFEFLKSDDPLFRPCQMVLGPDGAIYVCDWRTDSGGAGQLSGDGKHGRIYRVSWAGTKDQPAIPLRGMDSWAKIARLSEEELLQALAADDFSDRQRAQRALVRQGPTARPALLKLLANLRGPLAVRIEALGALESFWNDEVKAAFLRRLDDPEPDIRRLAADGLSLNCPPGDRDAHSALLNVLGDPEPAVRRAVALAMGRIAAPGAADALANAFKFDDGKDAYLRDGLIRAVERCGQDGMVKLLALADSGVELDRDKVVEAFLALRTRPAAEALPILLKNPHVSIPQRAALLHSYTNYLLDPPISLGPVADYLAANAAEAVPVQMAGLEVLSAVGALAKPNAVLADKIQSLLLALLEEKEPPLRLAVIKAVEDNRARRAAPRLAKLLGEGDRPQAERAAAAKALRVLGDRTVVPALKQVLDPARSQAAALQVEAFRSLAALDLEDAQREARALLDREDPALKGEGVQVLGTTPAGARLVGERFLAKRLPRELLPQVSEALRKHADKDPELAKLLSDVMKGGLLLSLDKAEVARVEALVKTKGDPRRGRALFLDAKKLACVTCHRLEGVGGNVGPDLTRLWDTHTIEKIMESIIDPSREIKEGFQTYQVTTRNGQVYTGLKVAQTAEELILRDANAKDVRVPAKDVEELTAVKQSLMPDNVVALLSFDQFIDLVAFLKDRVAQESLRGMATEFWVVGPFGGDWKQAYPPEANSDPAATYAGENAEKLSWQVQPAEPSGFLNLRAVLPRPGATGYALTYVHSPKDQKAQMVGGTAGAGKFWVNRREVHEQTTSVIPHPDQFRVNVTLKEGWNPVLVRVMSADPAQGVFLRFRGEGLRVAARPEGK
jgi:quinoprotein glucose dehydrogenase